MDWRVLFKKYGVDSPVLSFEIFGLKGPIRFQTRRAAEFTAFEFEPGLSSPEKNFKKNQKLETILKLVEIFKNWKNGFVKSSLKILK